MKLALATPLATAFGRQAWAAPDAAGSWIVVFYGVTPETTPETLQSALSPMIEAGLPVTVAVDPTAFLTHSAGAFPGLHSLAETPADLVDIVPLITDLARDEPYFQGRAGHDVRRRFDALLTSQGVPRARLEAAMTLAYAPEPVWTSAGVQVPAPMLSMPGLRAAGFRTVLQLYKASLASAEKETGNGVLTLSGGPRLTSDPRRSTRLMIESVASKDSSGQISFFFNTIPNSSPWAGLAKDARQSANRPHSLAPSDSPRPRRQPVALSEAIVGEATFHGRSSATFERLISVTIFGATGPGDAPEDAPTDPVRKIMARLDGMGVPATLLVPGAAQPPAPAALGVQVPASSLPVELPLDGAEAGIGADGIYRLGAVRRIAAGADPATLAGVLAGTRDIVIVIEAAALDDAAVTEALVSALVAVRLAGRTRFVAPADFASLAMAEDPTVRLAALSRGTPAPLPVKAVSSEARDRLIEDAQLAWRYIDRFTQRRTGICMATVQTENGYVATYDRLAMWDVGSQLQGIRAAHRLGLIDRDDFVARTKRLIEHLPRSRIAGRLLPNALVRARDGRGTLRAFYPSDVGRLLSAFALLRHEKELRATVDRAVGRWQLADMVRGGRLMEVDGGHESEFFQSQGAHYAVRAFAEFGIKAASPYPDQGLDSKTDWQMHLLYAAGRIGPLGPEPLLQEGIEMGFTPSSAYLARVLFGAQLRSHTETGQIVCPSESPIDRSPWFVYEGLRISDPGPRWSLQSDEEAANNAPGKAEAFPLLVSSKAAFMWAAVYPHPYSAQMLAFVRDRARVPGTGFASGVYVDSGTQTEGYADLNTNGVILSAIDHMLSGESKLSLD